ncbi:MAG: hypothetical protein ACC660_00675 [Acidimicrobiales bacterium]
MAPRELPKVVRVLPDVAGIRREFDYAIPQTLSDDGRAAEAAVGSMVRIQLHGRRVAGWITALDPEPEPNIELRPLAKISGIGPPAELIELARWAAHRWVGPTASLLGTASPQKMVSRLAAMVHGTPQPMPDVDLVRLAFSGDGSVVRVPPLGDRWPLILGAVAQGNALILVPSLAQAGTVSSRLNKRGVTTAVYPGDWARGAAGATVVGARSAALAPVAGLAAVLMVDEHDDVYQEERSPTWHAREVIVERARRAGVPCVLTSPIPTPEATAALPSLAPGRHEERAGWPLVRVVDPREDSAGRGTLWSAPVVRALRGIGRVGCVVNRKGRSRLLSCVACDELAVCTECDSALRQDDEAEFVCAGLGHRRPVVCSACGGTAFKNLRIGVSRAREELEVLLREPVVEVTADRDDSGASGSRVFVGTEAMLHRVSGLETVVFADFDQELVAPRFRAAEQAMALIIRAGRLVGGRRSGSGEVVLQTRQPGHPVVRAAVAADVEHWCSAIVARRELLRYPPYGALAEISGAAAAEFMQRLGRPPGVQVQGPVKGAWLARAPDPATLAEALNSVERPKGRLRIAVDPLRL